MARSALQPHTRRISRGPRRGVRIIPAVSVMAGSLVAVLPVVAASGWAPDFGFLMLIGWRLLRADAYPAWWAAPLGLVNDLLLGHPLGQSVALWAGAMLLLDLAEQRTMWRDYWVEWLLAALLISLGEWFEWRVSAWSGAALAPAALIAPTILAVVTFPLVAGVVQLIDRWRLGR